LQQFHSLEDGDNCNEVGTWRTDYEPILELDAGAGIQAPTGDFFSCDQTIASYSGFQHTCKETTIQNQATVPIAVLADNCAQQNDTLFYVSHGSTDPCPDADREYSCSHCQEGHGCSVDISYFEVDADGVRVPSDSLTLQVAEQGCMQGGGEFMAYSQP